MQKAQAGRSGHGAQVVKESSVTYERGHCGHEENRHRGHEAQWEKEDENEGVRTHRDGCEVAVKCARYR